MHDLQQAIQSQESQTLAGLAPHLPPGPVSSARHTREPLQIISAELAHGQLGLGGKLGYSTVGGDQVVVSDLEPGAITLSAHAPSELLIRTAYPLAVRGVLNGTAAARPWFPATFVIDEHPIGQVQGPFDSTALVFIPPGDHCLRVASRSHEERQTVWILAPSQQPARGLQPPKLRIVTIASYPANEAAEVLWPLAESAQYFGQFLSVMGVGTAYGNHAAAKIRRLLAYVKTLDAEYILFTDGKDSVLIGGVEEILAKFLDFHTDFVISMERGCWPVFDDAWRDAFPRNTDGWNFPNAGGWIGTKAGVIRVLERASELQRTLVSGEPSGPADKWRHLLAPLHQDDQALLQMLYLEGRIVGDLRCRIFTNVAMADRRMAGNTEYTFSEGRIRLDSTGEWPAILHFSGPSFVECRDRWPAYFRVSRSKRSNQANSYGLCGQI